MKKASLIQLAVCCILALPVRRALGEEQEPEPQRRFDYAFILEKPLPPILIGSGTVLTLTGAVLQILSLSSWKDFNSFTPDPHASGISQFQQVQAIQARAVTEHNLAVVSAGLGISCIFLGSFMLWDRWFNEPPPRKHRHHFSLEPRPDGLLLAFDLL